MESKQTDIIIIGAGITGLTLAHALSRNGKNVHVIEKSVRAGGAVQTLHQNGWKLETGPNTMLLTNTWFSDLIADCGLEDSMLTANRAAKNRFIVKNGNPEPLPLSPVKFFSSSFFSWNTKIRLLKEPFIGRMKTEDEALSEFVKRRLGQEFLDYAINPFVAGVYAGKPEYLSVRYGFPKLYALEKNHGSILKGALIGPGKNKDPKDIPRDKASMITFRNGNSEFINALVKQTGSHKFSFNETVESIKKVSEGGYSIQTLSGDKFSGKKLISTIPLHYLNEIEFKGFEKPSIPGRIQKVTYPPVSVVHLGFEKKDITHPLDGFGLLVPEVENRFILGALFNSSLFPGRTPDDSHALLTVFTGGSRHPQIVEMTDELIIQKALNDCKTLLGINGEPVLTHITHWPAAIPQYEVGYESMYSKMEDFEQSNPGFYFCGNFRGGISVGDCIKSASLAAISICAKH